MLTNNQSLAIEKTQEMLGGSLDETKLGFLEMWNDNLMVVSCAGSGKTKFCKSLIMSRILSGEVKPNEVLYMSFSKECIEDTKRQVASLLADTDITGDCVIKTVHSVFFALLKKLGILKNASQILSVTEEQRLMGRAQRALGFYDMSGDDLLKLYECECEGLEDPEHLLQRVFQGSVTGQRALSVLEMYKEMKERQLGLSEMGLLLLYMCTDAVDNQAVYLGKGLGLFDKYSGAGPTEQERAQYLSLVKAILHKYKLVVVDEVQDLNVTQHKFLELVFGVGAGVPIDTKLVFVGDDDQCIYEWRFSNVDLMRQAPVRYGLKCVYMTKSYRCCDAVMEIGERILKNCADEGRWEKPLSGRGEKGVVKEISPKCPDLAARADAFARVLCAYEFSDEIGTESATVLMRYRSSAVPVLLNLYDLENAASGVPEDRFHSVYILDGGLSSEKAIRDLKLACECALTRDTPSKVYSKLLPLMGTYLSADVRKKLLDYMDEYNVSIIELPFMLSGVSAPAPFRRERFEEDEKNAISSLKYVAGSVYQATFDEMTKLKTQYDNLVRVGKELNDYHVARYFASLCISNDKDARFCTPALGSGHDRGMCVYKWALSHIKAKEHNPTSEDGKICFRDILDVLNKVEERYTSTASSSVKKGRVKVRTVHSAKGLQWDTVIFIDGNTSSKGHIGNEELRINYVGVTRARNRLIV